MVGNTIMQLKEGTLISRTAQYMPPLLISLKDQVHEQSIDGSMRVLHDIIDPSRLPDLNRNKLILYLYAKFMDDIAVDEIEYSVELTKILLRRLIVLWFLHIQEKRGLLRLIAEPSLHTDDIRCFELTEEGLAYELFRTNSGLTLPAIRYIFIWYQDEAI